MVALGLYEVLAMIPTWLLWTIVIGIAAHWYLRKTYGYWKRAGVPYMLIIPFTSFARKISKIKAIHEIDIEIYKTYGRIFGYYEGKTPALFVADPDVLKDILVKDFHVFTGRRGLRVGDPLTDMMIANLRGKDWKRVRALVSPAFATGKIKKMIGIFIDSAKTLTGNLKAAAQDEKPADVERIFRAFAMDVIASAAFATKIDSHNDPENPFVSAAKKIFTTNVTWRIVLVFLFPAFARFFKISFLQPDALKFFETATLKIVEERKQSQQRRNDFLQLLIDAVEKGIEEEEEGRHEIDEVAAEMGHDRGSEQMLKSYLGSKSLSNDELVAQCVSFFLAGFNTTAGTLAFTAYELALHPEIQDKLMAEIDVVIEEKGELYYEDICEMNYLDNVICETLRKYPPGFRTERLADEEYHIKKHNITVPKGMIVAIPIYAMHHDPEYYPDPEKYDPDRFTPEQKSLRHPYSYLPFGAGPRNCVAMRFALMQMKVCLAYVLSQCRFVTCPETEIPLQFVRNLIAMQAKKVALKIEIRSGAQKY